VYKLIFYYLARSLTASVELAAFSIADVFYFAHFAEENYAVWFYINFSNFLPDSVIFLIFRSSTINKKMQHSINKIYEPFY